MLVSIVPLTFYMDWSRNI